MFISVILAWIAVVCLVLTALKFAVKKNRRLNRFFRKIHIPAGIVLVAAGLIHGLLAGNSPGSSFSDIYIGSELLSLNAGTLCFILAVLLGLTYCFRRRLKKAWIQLHRVLTLMILVVLVIHVAQVGITLPDFFMAEQAQQPSAAQSEIITPQASPEIESHDTPAPEAAVEADSTEPAEETLSPESTTVAAEVTDDANEGLPEQLDVTFSGAKLIDGTYEGSAEGYQSTIQVSVTVENGAVTSVDIVSQRETPKYWSRVTGLPDEIVDEQSLQLDAVSGATYSSKGILCAVYDALEQAVCDGQLQITIPQPSGRRH